MQQHFIDQLHLDTESRQGRHLGCSSDDQSWVEGKATQTLVELDLLVRKADLSTVASILVLLEGRLLVLRKTLQVSLSGSVCRMCRMNVASSQPQHYEPITGAESCLAFERPDDHSGCLWSNDGRMIQLIQNVNMLAALDGPMVCENSPAVSMHDTGSLFGELNLCLIHISIH